jgi:hypothetical protein
MQTGEGTGGDTPVPRLSWDAPGATIISISSLPRDADDTIRTRETPSGRVTKYPIAQDGARIAYDACSINIGTHTPSGTVYPRFELLDVFKKTMALYKNGNYLKKSESGTFDETYAPGTLTPFSGIYRCEVCGHEIVSVYNAQLPPQVHTKHPTDKPIAWRMIVFAQHNQPS